MRVLVNATTIIENTRNTIEYRPSAKDQLWLLRTYFSCRVRLRMLVPFQLYGRRIFVAGHRGMVGSALLRRLSSENCEILTTGERRLDLTRQAETEDYIRSLRPDAVIMAAARVGGILANSSFPADFLFQNLAMATNVIEGARRAGVKRLLMLGSSCIYPKMAPQPIPENALLTGPLETTNQWYAIAKIAALKLVEAYRRQYGLSYISAMPTNLYGPGDNFDLQSSHVLPALIRKAHEAKICGAKEIEIWGSGTPRREFLHVDDCADALVYLLQHYDDDEHVNVGSGSDLAIVDLMQLICEVVGVGATITFDRTKPDGTPRKLMCNETLRATGWSPQIGLREGIASTYDWFLSYQERSRLFQNPGNKIGFDRVQ
jgi:GDP-L-fucose synthase